VLADDPLPDAIQCVANALDLSGDMWVFGADEHPDNPGIRARAVDAGAPVIGIRGVAAEAAGPLTGDEMGAIEALRAD
jgi:hypothetical protein